MLFIGKTNGKIKDDLQLHVLRVCLYTAVYALIVYTWGL